MKTEIQAHFLTGIFKSYIVCMCVSKDSFQEPLLFLYDLGPRFGGNQITHWVISLTPSLGYYEDKINSSKLLRTVWGIKWTLNASPLISLSFGIESHYNML